MRCPTANQENAELLLAHVSRTLDAARAAVLEEHMARCPACRDYYAAQLAVWAALDHWEAPLVSPDFDRRLYRRIEAESRPWDFARVLGALLGPRTVPLAAAVCLMAATAIWLGRSGPPAPAAPPQSAAVQVLRPDQAANTLQEMEMIQDFSSMVQAGSADSRM